MGQGKADAWRFLEEKFDGWEWKWKWSRRDTKRNEVLGALVERAELVGPTLAAPSLCVGVRSERVNVGGPDHMWLHNEGTSNLWKGIANDRPR